MVFTATPRDYPEPVRSNFAANPPPDASVTVICILIYYCKSRFLKILKVRVDRLL